MRLSIILLTSSLACSALADVTAPAAEPGVLSPRRTFRVEQACEEQPDTRLCRVWVVSTRAPAKRKQLAEPDHDDIRELFPSDLSVSPDERYILRVQKLNTGATGAYLYERVGEADYRLTAHYDVAAAAVRLFARQVGGRAEDSGIVELDAWSSDGKSLVVTLRGREVADQDVSGWRCTFDIASGRAWVTSAQAKANAGTFSRTRFH